MKNHRKKKLINLSFQLRTAIPAILVTIISFSVIIGFILFMTSMSSVTSTARDLNRAVQNEYEIVQSFKEYAKRVKDPIFILATEKIESDHKQSIAVIKENIMTLRAYSENNSRFLVLAIAVMIINSILLYVLIIRSTHKAAGPVLAMHTLIRNILEGRSPDDRGIRKKDDFQEFYKDFEKLIEKYSKKNKRQTGSPIKAKPISIVKAGTDKKNENIS